MKKIINLIKKLFKKDKEFFEVLDEREINYETFVKGNLYLINQKSIKYIPNNLTVSSGLYLEGTSITSLPDSLNVGWHLNLNYCTRLKILPNNLYVKGSLLLGGCTSLKSLPDNLIVEENLYLGGCTSLINIPPTIKVGGTIFR